MSLSSVPSRVRGFWLRTILIGPAVVAAGCVVGKDDPGDPNDLQALLDDGDLVEMTARAQTSEADGGPGRRDAGAAADGGFGGMGGGAGGSGGGGPGPDGGFVSDQPVGQWDFNDCNEFRSELQDTAFNGHTAFRSVRVRCAEGIEGQGVTMPNPRDLVYVPDQPSFAFDQGVTVAGWVKPSSLSGVRSLVRKREGGTSSFALLLNDRRFQFVVARKGAAPAFVAAPGARKDAWTHVAATYDGTFLRLYVDGAEAARTRAPGVIDPGEGPLLMANDGSQRRFEGVLDGVWFSTAAASADTIRSLTCVRRPPTVTGTPAMSVPVAPETPVTYTIGIKNNNSDSCGPEGFFFSVQTFLPDFQIEPQFTELDAVASGETRELAMTVTAGAETEPGSFPISFVVFDSRFDEATNGEVTHVVAEAQGCRVLTRRELFVRDVSVVDDPIRTGFSAPTTDTRRGVWTFARLMTELSPRPEDAPDVVETLFRTWLSPQSINGFNVAARPAMQSLVLDPWPRRADGKLDLERAPLRLLGIVNRFDLRNLAQKSGGEGRFVFGVLGPGGFPLEFTVILEYRLPAQNEGEILAWANDWHALGTHVLPSEAYNAALQAVTDRFVRRGAIPLRPNGSALLSFRTNEIALARPWELREFTMDGSGRLRPDTIKLTPDLAFNGTTALADFINANEADIIAERHDVPATLNGLPFLGGAVFNQLNGWFAPGVRNPEARHKFSLNTCNGCHAGQETGTGFLQVFPRFAGQESSLSGFMTGTNVFDSQTGQVRRFNDLDRRRRDLHAIVCPNDPLPPPQGPPDAGMGGGGGGDGGRPMSADAAAPPPPPPAPPPQPKTSLSTGIRRVH